jgi:hypothetical protein
MKMNEKDFELLSAYVDNELSSEEKLRVDEMLASSLEMQKKLEDFKYLKTLINSVKPIPQSPYFETRLMAEIENPKKGFNKFLKFYPVLGLIIVTLGVMTVLKLNPGFIQNIWESQKSNLAGFYKENLQPLLYASDVSNEDLFNFAFNQELPLDKKQNQYLVLSYDDSGKEIVQIKTLENINSDQSYNQFVEALGLNPEQKMRVDSVIRSYAEAIEPQILVNENNTVAINPAIWSYRNAMVTDLLVLAKDLKKDKVLKIIPSDMNRIEQVHVVNAINKLKSSSDHQYIFLTPDSIFEEKYVYNIKDQKEKLKELKQRLNEQQEIVNSFEFNIRYDSTWKNFENEAHWNGKYKVKVGDNYCQVAFSSTDIPESQLPEIVSMNEMIKEATDNIRFNTFHIPRIEKIQNGGVVVQYVDNGDSIRSYSFHRQDYYLDSLMQMNRMILDSIMQVERQRNPIFNDSLLSRWFFNSDHNFDQFNSEELREQMKSLQEEFKKFREEMYMWKKEVKRQVNKKEN